MKSRIAFMTMVGAFLALNALYGAEGEEVWLTRETPHFLVHYSAGSPAEREIETLVGIVEGHFERETKIYGASEMLTRKVPYFFHSKPVMSRGRPVWGFTSQGEKGEIHVAYAGEMTDTSPHEFRHYVHRAVNPEAPAFFDEGSANIGVWVMGYHAHQILKAKYPGGLPDDLHNTITKMGNPYTDAEAAMAYSFCNFLAENYGEEGFGKMYATITKANYRESLKAYTGKNVDALNEEWIMVLVRTEVPESAEKLYRKQD